MKEKIRFLAMDVDGTLTDGKIYMGNAGEVFKAFNAKDGYGIHELLHKANVIPCIITGRTSTIVENRAAEIGITEIYQGVANKTQALKAVLAKYNIPVSEVAYIGDDMNDFDCMTFVKNCGGICGCPKDASFAIKELCCFVSEKNGGDGAVRSFIEYLLKTSRNCNF